MKVRPWRVEVGAIVGFAIGLVIWWSEYDRAEGLFQRPQLIIVPTALGILVVSLRNRRKKVGAYNPEIIERNRRGRP